MWNGINLTKEHAVLTIIVSTILLLCGCSMQSTDWQGALEDNLPLLGHRNWIVVADSAYPYQISPGIETIYTSGEQIRITETILKAIDEAEHVRAKVYLDAELKHISQADALGINEYRQQLKSILTDKDPVYIPHEELIAKLDEAAKTFKVLLLKTDMTLPYTSVFLELDCGYWDAQAEQKLRQSIK